MKSLAAARKAAIAYTAAFAVGSLISIKRGYVAAPLGLRTGNPVSKDVVRGFHGAGLAAPWNMIGQMWLALALSNRPGRAGRRGRAWLAFLSAVFVAGSVAEPVSHRIVMQDLPMPDMVVAVGNIVLPIVMLSGALLSLIEDEASS